MTQCRLFNVEEYKAQEERRIIAIDEWRDSHPEAPKGEWPTELSVLSASFFPPGSMWFCP